MMKNYTKSICIAVVLLCHTQFIQAQDTFTATEDVFVQGGSNDGTNYNQDGGSEHTELQVKIGSNSNFFRRTFVKFDLTAAGLSGADVDNAKLRVRVSDMQKNTADPVTVTASETTDVWSETTVTYATAPVSGTAISSVVGITGTDVDTDKDWDVTSYVKAELDGDKVISIVLEDLEGVNNTVTFSSKAGASAPQLIINDIALSASNLDIEQVISLYPNPAQESFLIETPNTKISDVKIFSINGSMLYQFNDVSAHQITIDTSKYNPGVYLVQITNEQGAQHVEKVIKN